MDDIGIAQIASGAQDAKRIIYPKPKSMKRYARRLKFLTQGRAPSAEFEDGSLMPGVALRLGEIHYEPLGTSRVKVVYNMKYSHGFFLGNNGRRSNLAISMLRWPNSEKPSVRTWKAFEMRLRPSKAKNFWKTASVSGVICSQCAS